MFHCALPAVLYIRRSRAIPAYTRPEERANAITHGLGVGLAIAATIALSQRAVASDDLWRVITYPVFGLTMILLYTASTIYHGHPDEERKPRLKVFDHVSIYYLIAGTYTPVTLVALRGPWGWALFGVVWALALAGTVYKLHFTGRFPVVSTILYVGMGWIAVAAIVPLIRNVPGPTLLWLLAGGVCYTGGVGFYAWRRLPFNHAIWHLFVLGGTICHFVLVMKL